MRTQVRLSPALCLAAIAAVACGACASAVDPISGATQPTPTDAASADGGEPADAAVPSADSSDATDAGTADAGDSDTSDGTADTVDSGTTALSVPIVGLFSTGVDDTAAPLPAGSVDPHYVLSSDDPGFPGPSAIAVGPATTNWPGNWVSDTSTSNWITIQLSTVGETGGIYTYTTTFSLAGMDPTSATITGTWACDDSCTLQLNGTQVASYASPAWSAVQSFTVPAGSPFASGSNALSVVVSNSGGYATGVQIVTIGGSAQRGG